MRSHGVRANTATMSSGLRTASQTPAMRQATESPPLQYWAKSRTIPASSPCRNVSVARPWNTEVNPVAKVPFGARLAEAGCLSWGYDPSPHCHVSF